MNSETSIPDPNGHSSLETEIIRLRKLVEDLTLKNSELETIVEIITDHSTTLENNLKEQNQTMVDYIEQVNTITAAAITVQNNTFNPNSLKSISARTDELGNLAQVFSETVQSVKHHEQQLIDANKHLSDLLEAYSRFVPEEYLIFLKQDSIINIQLGDHVSKEMAVMFSDIRSFTTLSEHMTPQENFNFINAYLRRVSPEIRNHNGFIVKYLGDGMMAVFPESVDDALQAGIAKAKRVTEYNQHRLSAGYQPLEVGIGIHVGHMMVGMVGEANRMQGDAFSDNVNLTARLEGLTKYYGASLLISEEVLGQLSQPEQYTFRLLDRVIVKGRQEPITIYEVLEADLETSHFLKKKTLALYQQARKFYQEGNWVQAQRYFEQVLKINPIDKTVQFYLERIQQLSQRSLPNGWQGIWSFTQK
ncbi:adenylate/guanylate cyclase domain-containing response regulator [Leptolyngbyaceae cyanobacterium CCMR0082]|uniref:Adenylate/guanylate cyclase domain-containing response regulator n=2 Tax=Adonisia turfae TaxID=2950184 RepID=A0A6M0SBA7_9CYAN|nr:adenylate/guanylate cyclase domain-containing protein [Adonisia turfae]MDV3347386.1 adenylate/guanylate cyclase domain-containing protein [Leptothoe sp. LEGE 181152]NEZ59858.1 adenylate/guanylate cyclase domain-containing response regulator [Adonisia turfae CCMR0081]NEZ64952.1 adenylate/guanylate cyclase domain-containing response regulator [Adonisia turfae CCMR0082]